MKKSAKPLLAASLAAALIAPAWGAPAYSEFTPGPPLAGEFHSMGSPTMDAVTLGWIELFRRAHPEIEDVTTMEARNNNTVALGLAEGLSQVGPCSRTLFPAEIAQFVKKLGYEPTCVRVCGGAYDRAGYSPALAVYVNENNPLMAIALEQLEEIYARDGKVTTWGQMGLTGDWADKPIHLYGLNLPNGISTFFQEAAMHGREFRSGIATRSTVRAPAGTVRALSVMVQAVGADRFGICYAGPSNAKAGAKILPISTAPGARAVSLSRETVLNHTCPLSRYLYAYINRPPGTPVDPKVKEFLRIVLSREGQEVVSRLGVLLPMPPDVAREELAKLE